MTGLSPPQPTNAVNVVRQWGDGELLVPASADVLPWDLAIQHIGEGHLFWHVSLRADMSPHIRPVFAVECDGVLHSTTSAGARKTHLLQRQRRCSLATSTDGMDLVYEGVARRVHASDQLARVADAYHSKYGWPVTVMPEGAFDAPFGAPAAGPPPYHVYAIDPVKVWGFGTDDRYATRSTRWDFQTT